MAIKDNLIVWFDFDEASGNAVDAHTNGYDFTETGGTIASATGKLGDARDFEDADTEWFERASNADLQSGEGSITIAGWVWAETLNGSGGFPVAANKGWKNIADANSEWVLYCQSGTPVFGVSNASLGTTVSSSGGAISDSAWHHLVGRLDVANELLDIFVDGVKTTSAYAGGIDSGTETFELGASSRQSLYWDGLLDAFGFWKRALTDTEVAFLYNSGNGRAYSDLGLSVIPILHNGKLLLVAP